MLLQPLDTSSGGWIYPTTATCCCPTLSSPSAFLASCCVTHTSIISSIQHLPANPFLRPQAKWEETEDKPAALAVTGGALLLLVAASSVVDAVDKIPIISDLIELVGVVVTGW